MFTNLLAEYGLPSDLSFHIDIPVYVQEILNAEIVVTELGATLRMISNGLYKAKEEWENQSIIEDSANHFHVDSYIENPDNKEAFMLGIKTLVLLAQKFENQKIKGIRFWYYFQTPELGKQWAIARSLHSSDDDEYFISDRLSFYTLREGEDIVTAATIDNLYGATLIIDL